MLPDNKKTVVIDEKRNLMLNFSGTVPFYQIPDITLDRSTVAEVNDCFGKEPVSAVKLKFLYTPDEEDAVETEGLRDLTYITEITSPLTDISMCLYLDEETGDLIQMMNPDYYSTEVPGNEACASFYYVGTCRKSRTDGSVLLEDISNKEKFKTINPVDPDKILLLNLVGVERGHKDRVKIDLGDFELYKHKNIVMFAEFSRDSLIGDPTFVNVIEAVSPGLHSVFNSYMSEEDKIYLPLMF